LDTLNSSFYHLHICSRFNFTISSILSDFSDQNGGLYFLGISKSIEIKSGFIDFVIIPTFTLMITILTLFFSFFIKKIFGGNNE